MDIVIDYCSLVIAVATVAIITAVATAVIITIPQLT